MPYQNHSPDEVATRGQEIYEREIRPRLAPDDRGRFVVADIETGEYEIDDSDLAATKRALAKHPEAILYNVRIGADAAYRIRAESAQTRTSAAPPPNASPNRPRIGPTTSRRNASTCSGARPT